MHQVFQGLQALGVDSPLAQLLVMTLAATLSMALLGALIAKYLVLPLRLAPPLNTLLITLMLGSVLRESVRLFYPQGSNPKLYPRLLPTDSLSLGSFTLRADSLILLLAGLAAIVAVHLLITRTKLGLAIRAVAQDAETARIMGINFEFIVLLTFAIGSGMAALGGVMNGLYYNEINFGVGLLLGVIGFSAAVIGGLGNIYGAILGGFLFSAKMFEFLLYQDAPGKPLTVACKGFFNSVYFHQIRTDSEDHARPSRIAARYIRTVSVIPNSNASATSA